MGLDETVRHDSGKSSATVKSTAASPQGFGTLMQMTQPGEYRGKRVRLSGWVKSDKVTQWAGLWFRVDGPNPNTPLAFDNMQERAIKGTTEWTRYEIVLDVPDNAQRLAYGILLAGAGQVWMRAAVRSTPLTPVDAARFDAGVLARVRRESHAQITGAWLAAAAALVIGVSSALLILHDHAAAPPSNRTAAAGVADLSEVPGWTAGRQLLALDCGVGDAASCLVEAPPGLLAGN